MLSNERWTPVSTHPQYEVSTEGRVRNTKTGLILRPQYNGEVFESVKAAAEHFGVFATEISAVLNGRRTTARGNRFEIVGEDA